jgi:hypothetical protein
MNETEKERDERTARLDTKLERLSKLEQTFAAIWGSDAAFDARWAREQFIDGDLAAIPTAHRLVIVRQLFIILSEHDLLHYSLDDADAHLRGVAARVGLPYLEVLHAWQASVSGPDVTRDDVDDWLQWCRENAPDRLAAKEGGA